MKSQGWKIVLQISSNKWIACVILHLLGLLYHTTVDRKDTFAGEVLSAAHTLD